MTNIYPPTLSFCLYWIHKVYRHFFFIYQKCYFIYKGFSDRQKLEKLSRIIKPGMQILDIGANIGYYTIFFSRLVGKQGRVYAFEPEPLNFSYLKRNTRNINNIILNNLAVSENSGEISLYCSDLSNVDAQTYDSGENRRALTVKCVSIDDYFPNAQKVDLVKLDIQGYEYFAIKGMVNTLANSAGVVLAGEFWPYGLKKSGVEPRQLIELLEKMNFEIEFERGYPREELYKKVDEPLFYIDFFATIRGRKKASLSTYP